MSATTRVLLGLVAGFALGIAAAHSGSAPLVAVATAVEPLGTMWVNAIRMTVVPLVVASLVVGVAGASDQRVIGRLGWRAVVCFVAILAAAGAFTALLAPPVLALLPVDADAVAALRASVASRASAGGEQARLPTAGEWLVELVPANPIRAAADGAMLPLIVFAVLFGLAAGRLDDRRRQAILVAASAVAEACLTLVRWILVVAPVGVFALALPLAARLGVSAVGAVATYVAVVATACVAFSLLVLYPVAVVLGRVRLRDFAAATLPAQAVAFSSRSSLASLPVMIEQARDRLRRGPAVTGFLLPLAASSFRTGAGVGITAGVLFIARLYGIEVGPAQLVAIVVTVVVTSFGIPGVPGGFVIAMVPALLAAGVPPEGVGVLMAVDTVPDMFRTTTNVTGDMVAAAVLGRGEAHGRAAAVTSDA